VIVLTAYMNVTFQNAWAREPVVGWGTLTKDTEGGWEGRRHKKMLPLVESCEWVCHCATGPSCIAQVLPKRQRGEEVAWGWFRRRPVQEPWHEPPYATSIGGLLVSGEIIAICSYSW